jgi:gliding motility-associated-like protein
MNMKKRIHEKARSFLILLLTLGLQQAIAQPTASVSSLTNVACNGTATGSISVNFSHTASTTFTVQLDSAGTVIRTHTTASAAFSGSHTFNNLRANTYRVHVKENATNLTKTINGITVTQPTALVLTANIHNVRCKGLANGAVKLFGSGGTLISGTYVFKKGTGSFSTVDTFSSFSPGGYNFYVSDDNGCFDTLVVSITEPAVLKLSISILNSTCKGGAKVDLAATGGTSPYQFDLLSTGIYNSTVQYLNYTDTSGVKSKVKDSKGCLDSSSLLIKHTDAVAPTAVTKNITVFLDSATGTVTVKAASLDNGSTDNCGPLRFAISDSTFNCADTAAPQTVDFFAIDLNGNKNTTKTAVITVKDKTAPANLIYSLVDLYLDSAGSANLTAAMVDSASFDACGINTAKTFLGQVAFGCVHAGKITSVAYRIQDYSGNSRTVTAKIAVHDTFAPDLKLRTIANRSLDSLGADTLKISSVVLSTYDACGVDTFYFASATDTMLFFTCADKGSKKVGVYAKDKNGNKRYKEVTFTITDSRAPDSLRIITDTILYLDASGQALLPKKEVVKYTYDNCGVTDTTMKTVFTCADLGSATYTVTVKDAAGNAISKNIEIQVLDTLAPDTPTVYNITRYLDSNGRDTVLPVLLYNTSNDNCGITEIYTSDSFLTCGDTGTFGIIVFVKDKSGNISSDTAYVTLLDTLAPYNVVVRDSIVVYLGPNGTYTLHDSDYLISAFDNCKITDTLYSQKTFFCTDISGDSIMVYVRFRDASKNETLDSFAVYVLDTLAPIVNARTRDTVYLGPTVNPTKTIGVADIDLGSTDNSPCIPLDVKISGKTTFDCDDATKEFKVYLTGTDGYGNTAKDSTMVLVLDTVKPVIVLKSTIPPFYIGASGLNVIKVVDIDGGTYDNCAILKREIIGDSLKCTDGPTKKIVFRVTDKFGNIAQTAFNVSVLDTIKPALLTKSATLNIGTSGFAVLKVNDVISSATDNCNVDSMWISRDTFYVSDADPTLPFVIVSVRDKAGNITKKTQYVFVYVLDSDNDSIPDYIEKNFDTDGDGTLDYLDTDADNDGLADKTENNGKHALLDSDGDGIHDFRDLDSDNDGINDVIENGSTDVIGDGINDNPATILTVAVDTDTDGKPDYLDLDSDGDVLFDIFESLQGHTDANNDGQIDATADADKDGIIDQADGNTAAFGDNGDVKPIDTDSDVKMDFRDTDSDNDLIPDSVETAIDTDADGLADYRDTDSDNDKIPDTYEAGIDPTKPVDTDTDGLADFRDTDSDNDKIPDTYEAGADPTKPVDTDTDGKDDFRDLDSDGDTISDEVEAGADPKNPVDTDGDGKDDFRDLDSDGDGIPDAIEAGADPKNPVDTNNDGVEDFRDLDSDGDGISDAIERGADGNNPIDTDGDGIPDYRDTDADNDDIPDSDEGQADSDKNGIPDYRDAQYRIPEGFSPNGDGVNELFIIKGLKVYKNAQLIVFNRNGQVVFDSGDGYGNNWDGSSSSSMPSIGKDLPEGLYYFVFKPNAQNRADITGNLYIKR